jgi:lysyl-tRNA synthetase class 2
METHIRPFRITPSGIPDSFDSAYLATSPEFAMKRLLASGMERIFQICPAFRAEPFSPTHHPEFTLLEFYRAHADDQAILKDTEELFEFLAMDLFGKPELTYQGRTISVKTPWPRFTVRELFRAHAGVELISDGRPAPLESHLKRLGLTMNATDTWDDQYFKIWLNVIEPELPANHAVFVTRYPASQSALAVQSKDPDGTLWAKRFELYAGGLELGNAFEELTDADEQRRRFVHDMNERAAAYGDSFPKSPIDEEFLAALRKMPPAAGIAIGVDRMVMLFADEPNIDFTFWLPAYGGPTLPPAGS